MKFQVECSIVLVLLWSVPLVGQTGTGQASQNTVIHDTITIIGPNGAADGHNAPTVLKVVGGRGGDGGINNVNSGAGGGIVFTAGSGGASSQDAGSGGSIKFTAGNGGTSSEVGGSGGSITLQPGAAQCGVICGSAGNVILSVPKGGFVGIGTNSPSNTLEVVAEGTTLADAWMVRSARRFKTNIQPLQGALEKVEQLQAVSYQRKSDGRQEIGVVAEDVDQVVPEVVSHDPQTNAVQGVDYSRLAALLIEAVKSQQAEIEQLKAQVEQLTANAPQR